jgi:excisionase family DNA binding protein
MKNHEDSRPTPLAYTVTRAVEVSGLSRSAIFEAVKAGELRSTKKGRRRLIFHESLVEYLKPADGAAS